MDIQPHCLIFALEIGSDPSTFISSHPQIRFTQKCIFNLILKEPIPLPHLMKHLNGFYQTLVNYNSHIHYEIYPSPLDLIETETFPKTCLGGTFDHIHSGHLLLLTYGCLLTKTELTVGITGPSMLTKKKYQEMLQSYQFREENVRRFLKRLNAGIEYRFAQLKEPFGPPLVEEDYQAIIVSPETRPGGEELNKLREEQKFPPMKIFEIEYIGQSGGDSKDRQGKISSTGIRKYLFEKNRLTEEGAKQKYHNMWLHLHSKMGKEFGEKSEEEVNKVLEIEFDKIFNAYSESWRHFHTNEHIYSLLTECFVLPALELKEEEIALTYAIYYHDIVYDPRSSTNEEDSVIVWRQYADKLRPFFNKSLDNLIKRVTDLILSTKKHSPKNPLEERLIDLDMGILDSEPAKYRQYSEDIRNEYSPIFPTIEAYNEKRKGFLESLDLSTVFSHRKVKHLKDNITHQIQELRQSINKSQEPSKL